MVTITAPMCLWCRHYQRDAEVPRCVAFPTRIPRYIYDRQRRLHILPLKDDHGFQFELMTASEQVAAFGQALSLSEGHQRAYDRLAPNRDVVVSEMPANYSNGE